MEHWTGAARTPYLSLFDGFINDEDKFNNFRKDNKYLSIVGTDSFNKSIGDSFFKEIKKRFPGILRLMEPLIECDDIGNPIRYEFECGVCSITLLRYMHVLGSIDALFGGVHSKNIVEIGGGWGGQRNVFAVCYNSEINYTIIDLPEPKKLIDKVQSKILKREDRFPCVTPDTIPNQKWDLVISEYCLSELTDEGIDFYFDKIVSKSQNCYFTMNLWDKQRKDRVINLVKDMFQECIVLDINPQLDTHPANYHIIGKTNDEVFNSNM
jgi:hypothetical protein